MSTVIIPAYRADWCLERCLKSIAGQTRRPACVLIGVDACRDTLPEAIRQAELYNGRGAGRGSSLRIRLYWFPRNVGPYRVRNTLAMLADEGLLHFFDADDEMFPDHLETMEALAGPGVFATPRSVVHKPDGSIGSWTRAHGVVCITKHDLVVQGGWEPWRCAADTEALQRWQWGGMAMRMPDDATLAVHKHTGGLTQNPATRIGSDFRNRYKAEVKRRAKNPVRCACIGVAECRPVTDGMSLEPSIPLPPPRDGVQRPDSGAGAAKGSGRKPRRMGYAEYMRQVVGKDPRRRR